MTVAPLARLSLEVVMILSIVFAFAVSAAQEQSVKPEPATNTICPVMGNAVGEKSTVVVVRGKSYRICCAPCGQKMEKNPDKYLEQDGTPKNAKK